MIVRDSLVMSPDRQPDGVWKALLGLVSEVSGAPDVELEDNSPAATGSHLNWNPPDDVVTRVLSSGPGDWLFPECVDESVGKKCCPEKFDYPVPGSVEPYDREHGGFGKPQTKLVGWRFDVYAEYRQDEGEEITCDCKCCEFRQYVTSSVSINGVKDARRSLTPRMDCTRNRTRTVCPGARAPEHRYSSDARAVDGRIVERYDDACRYHYHDVPHVEVRWGEAFSVRWDFTGVIHDRCNNWARVWTKQFWLSSSGKVQDDGNVDYKRDPAGEPQAWQRGVPEGTRRLF
jgi:hypothetical protein